MTKLTLDMSTFKALASDTRLDILKALDGKKMALKDICDATKLNKATLHEHLSKLNEAGLVKKKEREGHKWVYYKLTWKGECLLHPENTRIVVLFSTTFLTLFVGIINLVNYVKGQVIDQAVNSIGSGSTVLYSKIGSAPIEETNEQLSRSLVENSNLKGLLGNTITPDDIDWTAPASGSNPASLGDSCTYGGGGLGSLPNGAEGAATSNVPSNMIAIVHDPSFQYIAIACIVIFSILICISLWRFKKSKTLKF